MKIKLKNPNEFRKTLIVQGFSQTEFAREVGITAPYLNQIVNEERNPSAKIARKISFKLGKEFSEIFFIEDVCKS